MRAKEFISEEALAGTTSSGSIGLVAAPLGSIIYRLQPARQAKYANSIVKRKTRKPYVDR